MHVIDELIQTNGTAYTNLVPDVVIGLQRGQIMLDGYNETVTFHKLLEQCT